MSRLTVLHIEDSANDALQVELALDSADPDWRKFAALHRVASVQQARPFLRDHRPHLVMLDLSLPGVSGHDFLGELKSDPATQQIPVVVLSNSNNAGDVDRAYRGFASCYLVKPDSFLTLVELMGDLKRFWMQRVRLPN